MESASDQRVSTHKADPGQACGRPGCPCALPVSERFVLWAMRQWQEERALPDFAIAMDAVLFGARRAIKICQPACSHITSDEATLVALCGLAQSDHDSRMMASLGVMMAPTAARVAGIRLKAFAVALAHAGLRLSPAPGEPGARLN